MPQNTAVCEWEIEIAEVGIQAQTGTQLSFALLNAALSDGIETQLIT